MLLLFVFVVVVFVCFVFACFVLCCVCVFIIVFVFRVLCGVRQFVFCMGIVFDLSGLGSLCIVSCVCVSVLSVLELVSVRNVFVCCCVVMRVVCVFRLCMFV